MTNQYEIQNISSAWERGREQMGSKRKFWYLPPEDGGHYWLFKYPKPNTGEHWAEKIAAEIAQILNITHAPVELALFKKQRGSTTESFARDGRSLWHGNQVLAGAVRGYDPQGKFRQSSHTLENIFASLACVFTSPDGAKLAKRTIAKYIILDALIGNTDRHHENWGILRRRVAGQWQGFVAPSFDHASSLGRELLDERRELLLAENRIGHYAERGRGGIYWLESDTRAPSPLDLARRAVNAHPDLFSAMLKRLQTLNEQAIMSTIDRIPMAWMTSLARKFACNLMLYNLKELRRLTP